MLRTSLVKASKLGVGLNYQPQFLNFLEDHHQEFDFLEIVPDIFWTDRGRGAKPRYVDDQVSLEFLHRMQKRMPVVMHSIGLSIGSAHRFNAAHLSQVARWQQWIRSPWHSDHLAYHLTDAALAGAHGFSRAAASAGTDLNAGITMPLARNRATLALLAKRIEAVQRKVDAPFLLENNVYFVDMPGDEMDEAEFLNAICRQTGCGLLLDLHNIYCNSRNMGTSARALLERLDLSHVVEIHIAGGQEDGRYYLDAHSGPTPEPVWEMLDWVLPRAANVGGIVFELFGSWYAPMGERRLSAELDRMKQAWRRGVRAPARAVAVAS